MGERIITPQAYPLWAAIVPSSDAGQPLMTDGGAPITEDLVDYIYPSCYRVIAWEHPPESAESHAPLPVLLGAEAMPDQFFQFAQDREEAENLARLRIREQLRKQTAHH